MEVGEFGLCDLLCIFGFGAGRDERKIKKKKLIRWVRVMEVGEFGLCTIFFVYLGLGCEEMRVQRREERKI